MCLYLCTTVVVLHVCFILLYRFVLNRIRQEVDLMRNLYKKNSLLFCMKRVQFEYIQINLASPERIKNWGERILSNALCSSDLLLNFLSGCKSRFRLVYSVIVSLQLFSYSPFAALYYSIIKKTL